MMTRQLQVYRNEKKYYIGLADYRVISGVFAKAMTVDPYAGHGNEYWIRSLYFDNMTNSDYYDKMLGLDERKKIRLRLYDVEHPELKIEIKNKNGDKSLKETSFLSRPDAQALIDGKRSFLLERNDPVLARVYYLMAGDYYRPTTVVDYEREAYLCDFQHIRVTFDKNIRAGMGDFRIFSRDLNLVPVFGEKTIVMEVKYNSYLPGWIRTVLSGRKAFRAAIGKYCMGRWLE